jgi:hypothetical protein
MNARQHGTSRIPPTSAYLTLEPISDLRTRELARSRRDYLTNRLCNPVVIVPLADERARGWAPRGRTASALLAEVKYLAEYACALNIQLFDLRFDSGEH